MTTNFTWPFPEVNGKRIPESQALLDQKKRQQTPTDLSDIPDALF